MARIEIDLPDDLADELRIVAEQIGIRDTAEAAVIAVGDWVSRRKAELDNRDPSQKYFVNEALDEIGEKKK